MYITTVYNVLRIGNHRFLTTKDVENL